MLAAIAHFSDRPEEAMRIAAEAQRTFHPLFQPVSIARYWAIVLSAWLRLLDMPDEVCEANARRIQTLDAPLDITAHVAVKGDVWAWPRLEAGLAGSGCAIEGVLLHSACPAIDTRDLRYQVIDREGGISPWVRGGHFAGSRGRASPLIAFRARLAGASARRARLLYAGRSLTTGHIVHPDDEGWVISPQGFETLHFAVETGAPSPA